jgi:hypothetical protein
LYEYGAWRAISSDFIRVEAQGRQAEHAEPEAGAARQGGRHARRQVSRAILKENSQLVQKVDEN